jgi:APA family basic amino acid/polyamine antiporter
MTPLTRPDVETPASSSLDALPRRLGLVTTIGVVVGTIIGSGIFRMPSAVAAEVGSVAGVMTVWTLGGLISLCGALSLAELAAAFPRSGGVFVHLREIYGDAVAFLFGWTMLFIGPAAIAGVSLVFAEYAAALAGSDPWTVRPLAAAAILVCSAVAYRSVEGMGRLLTAASAAKAGALVAIVVVAFLFASGDAGSFAAGAPQASDARWGGLGVALVAALWAYNGFHDMVSVAGEVRDPGRALPRALLAGMAIVIGVYVAANAAYLFVLPFDVMRASPIVASDTMVAAVGPIGASVVAVMVMVSTFGAVLGIALTNPRVYYAIASAGLLFAPLARVHPRHRTPHVAVLAHMAVALVCVWWRTFEQLAASFVLGIWPFLALAAAGVIVLRRRSPDLDRPYRVPGYPVVPLVFILGTAAVVASALAAQPVPTLAGIALTLLGAPVYFARAATRLRVK